MSIQAYQRHKAFWNDPRSEEKRAKDNFVPLKIVDTGIQLKKIIPIANLEAVQPVPVKIIPHVVPPVTVVMPRSDTTLVNLIQRTVAAHYGVTREDIFSRRRTKEMVRPRHVAMYLARVMTHQSLPWIAQRFLKDHTTCLNAIRKIEEARSSDKALDELITELMAKITERHDAPQ